MKTKIKLRIKSLQYHKWLAWLGAAGLLLFGLSGMLHPLMLWTGPVPAAFYPPKAVMQAGQAAAIPRILSQHGITAPLLVKLVPSGEDVLVQVTDAPDRPRRYFDPETGLELEGHDMRHAIGLARYYSGEKLADVAAVEFQTAFDNAYPWVNRLLPVYKVTFDTPDQRTVFVHTELNALANLTNNWKTTLQTLFGLVHTWNFLDGMEALRVVAMGVLLASLFTLTVAGMVLACTLKARPGPSAPRRWHRRMAYVLWLPLLAFSASGSYHLLQYSYGENTRGMRMGMPLPVQPQALEQSGAWLARYDGVELGGVSLVMGEGGRLFYRLGLAESGAMPSREQKYDGVAQERGAVYVDAATGEESAMGDKQMARFVAGWHQSGERPAQLSRIHAFSSAYDFRNKRLPAWQVDYPSGQTLFIDPAGGLLIDRASPPEKLEAMVFAQVHKWNFIGDAIGRFPRDVLVWLVLLSAIALCVLGLRLKTAKCE